MPWFDGTFPVSEKYLKVFFPKKIAKNIFADSFGRRGLILFDLEETSKDPKYATVQPYDKNGNQLVFYFPVFGKDAPKIARFIKKNCLSISEEEVSKQRKALLDSLDDEMRQKVNQDHGYVSEFLDYNTFSEDTYVFLLVGKKQGEYILLGTFEYIDCLNDSFKVLTNKDNQYTPIPLKKQLHNCPVCGARSLEFLGYFEICRECGHEDSWFEEGYIKNQRINYFKNKIKNPLYSYKNSRTGEYSDPEYLLHTDIEDLFDGDEGENK